MTETLCYRHNHTLRSLISALDKMENLFVSLLSTFSSNYALGYPCLSPPVSQDGSPEDDVPTY